MSVWRWRLVGWLDGGRMVGGCSKSHACMGGNFGVNSPLFFGTDYP